MELKDFMEVTSYRITEGSEYCWNCFGPNAYRLDSWSGAWNNSTEGYTITIVFDTVTQTVYEVEAWDYFNDRAYRWMNPEYKLAHDTEACQRGIDAREAWDDVRFVDLEVEADFLEKARAIVANEDYDTRVVVPIDLPDDELFGLMKMAHEQDITLNKLVEKILTNYIDYLKGTGTI